MTGQLEREREDFGTYPHVDIPPGPPLLLLLICVEVF